MTTYQPPLVAVRSYQAEVRGRLLRDPAALVCLGILTALVLAAIAAPLLTSYDPVRVSVTERLLPIGSARHLLGTDELGRDVVTRLLFGGRLSLLTGIVPILVAAAVGTLLGAVIAYVGGPLGAALARAMDMSYAFPAILIGIAVTASLGPGVANSIIAS